MDLAEFLLARIDEDEATADGLHDRGRLDVREGCDQYSYDPRCCDCGVPARVLAECAAKRAIVEEYRASAGPSYEDADVDYDAGRESGLEAAVRLLASPYAAHPDYRPEWAPTG